MQRVLKSFIASTGLAAILTGGFIGLAQAEGELNLYSSRHYDTDEKLYTDFEAATGITINRIEGKDN
jgi:iron(III) transport system substrate-binding protein